MKTRKQIIVSIVVLTFAGQFTALAARGPADGESAGVQSQTPPAAYAPRVGIIGGSIDEQLIEDARPMVDKAPEGLFITAPYINSMIVMEVRVYNDKGEEVIKTRSIGEPVDLMATGLPDGEYRYEAVTVFMLDEPIGRGADYTDEGISRNFGNFTISSDTLIEDQRPDPRNQPVTREEASVLERVIKQATYFAGVTLNFLVPSAQAQNLTTSSANPTLFYNDTNDGGVNWQTTGEGFYNDYRILDRVGTNFHQVIDIDGASGSTLNVNAFDVDADGDLHWGGSLMHLDKGAGTLSLGWTSTATDISASGIAPDIRLHDTTDTSEAEWELDNGIVRFWGRPSTADPWTAPIIYDVNAPDNSLYINSVGKLGLGTSTPTKEVHTVGPDTPTLRLEQDAIPFGAQTWDVSANEFGFFVVDITNSRVPFQIRVGAPYDSLVVDSLGRTGIGTYSPAASLNVTRSDGTTQVLVEETGAPATRTLMLLKNPGRTHFKIQNTDYGSEWVFTNTGPAFFISLQGTGGPEFKIQNNGNATLAGTLTQGSDVNAKTAFTAIDSYEILDLVSKLPVSKWEYKDARGEAHIGPMAQDFYAAFGLGASETGISSIDTGGVALAAIKALNEENISLREQVTSMQEQNVSILKGQAALVAELENLKLQQASVQALMATLIEAQQAAPVLAKIAMN